MQRRGWSGDWRPKLHFAGLRKSVANANSYGGCFSHSDSYRYGYSYGNGNSYSYTHTDGNSNRYTHTDSNSNCYSNADCDRTTTVYTDTTASTNTAATTLVGFRNSFVGEAVSFPYSCLLIEANQVALADREP